MCLIPCKFFFSPVLVWVLAGDVLGHWWWWSVQGQQKGLWWILQFSRGTAHSFTNTVVVLSSLFGWPFIFLPLYSPLKSLPPFPFFLIHAGSFRLSFCVNIAVIKPPIFLKKLKMVEGLSQPGVKGWPVPLALPIPVAIDAESSWLHPAMANPKANCKS